MSSPPCHSVHDGDLELETRMKNRSDVKDSSKCRYAISMEWYRRWKDHLPSVTARHGSNDLGPIDNSNLFYDGKFATMKADAKEDLDYVWVTEEVWNYIETKYGLMEGQTPLTERSSDRSDQMQITEFSTSGICGKECDCQSVDSKDSVTTSSYFSLAQPGCKNYAFRDGSPELKTMFENSANSPSVSEKSIVMDAVMNICDGENPTVSAIDAYKSEDSAITDLAGVNNVSDQLSGKSCSLSNMFSIRCRVPGLVGLSNQGNTCYMNSALQCLSNTAVLTQYFLDGKYKKEINYFNSFGTGGKVAIAYAKLLSEIWANIDLKAEFYPSEFKQVISQYSSQFSGYNQHDAQEFVSIFLDFLHEDLNRGIVKAQEVCEVIAELPDEEKAHIFWNNHLKRNNSVIVDHFHGQFRSTIRCNECDTVSKTFDPFCFLSLPIPERHESICNLVVFPYSADETFYVEELMVPKTCLCEKFVNLVSDKTGIPSTNIVLASMCGYQQARVMKPYEEIFQMRSSVVFAYEMSEGAGKGGGNRKYVFVYQRCDSDSVRSGSYMDSSTIAPVLVSFEGSLTYKGLYRLVLERLKHLFMSERVSDDKYEELLDDINQSVNECDLVQNLKFPYRLSFNANTFGGNAMSHEFNISCDRMEESSRLFVIWNVPIKDYLKPCVMNKWPVAGAANIHSDISIHECIRSFLEVELLENTNSWYCPKCHKNQSAEKKIDFWRLPNILIIHLKRFCFTKYNRAKIDVRVTFPAVNLDMTSYIDKKNGVSHLYNLYAVANHTGSLYSGHYVASIKNHLNDQWYYFNDGLITELTSRSVVDGAYLLFYERIS